MANKRLVRHYDDKYGNAAEGTSARTIRLVKYPNDRFEASVKHITELFEGGSVMELGGGDGVIARSLLAAGFDCHRYVLTDLSENRVRQAAESINDPRIETYTLDIESDAFEKEHSESFDCVIMVALIEHLIDPISAMKNIRGILRPGGFVYIITPNIARWTKRARLMVGQFPSTASKEEGLRTFDGGPVDLHDEGHLHYFTFRSLSRLLTEYCGYSQCRKAPYWEGTRLFPKPVEQALATMWPEMFSELALIGYR